MFGSIQWGYGSSGSSGALGIPIAVRVATGALVAGAPKSVLHGLNRNNFLFIARDAADNNNAEVDTLTTDPANPVTLMNNLIIEVSVNIPAGLWVNVIGWN